MFIERKFKRFFFAPEERNVADLAYSPPQTWRSAGARVVGFIAGSINIRLLRSQRVVWLRP
jgi:hypothetical protein